MTRILITGGAGYIGSYMTGYFLDRGYAVTVLDRCFFGEESLEAYRRREGFRLVKDDIRFFDPAVMDDVDVVIDLAGIANDPACDLDVALTDEINHLGSLRVARLAKERGVKRYLFSSSCSVYGFGQKLHLTEESPVHPVSEYARAKLRAEQAILPLADESFTVTLLRNATLFGLSPKMRFDLVINVMTLFAFNEGRIYVLGGGEQWRPIVHIEDVCRACKAVMDAPEDLVNGEIFNVGASEMNYQIATLARIVKELVPGTELMIVPSDIDKRTYNVNFDKISEVLGFQALRGPEDGVREIYDALLRGQVKEELKTKTVEYYKFLLEAKRILDQVLLDGRLF